jgi:hypothetical protein
VIKPQIFFDQNQPPWTKEYFQYVVNLFLTVAEDCNFQCNFLFGNVHYNFDNDLPVIKVDIQTEHTLVKPGGRDSWGAEQGAVQFEGGTYLVRVMGLEYLMTRNIVVEYSNPNFENIKRHGKLDDFLKKIALVSPMIYEPKKITFLESKKYDCVTMFVNANEPRRKEFIDQMRSEKVPFENVQNCFGKDELENLYKDTKIIINVRQTNHHHTLEELRILPALLNGVIVISEDCPLRECVPYQEFVLFTSLENIPNLAKQTLQNYESTWKSIFDTPKFMQTIQQLKLDNIQRVTKKLLDVKNGS